MNKTITLIILMLTLANGDELSKSCKNYQYLQCMDDDWIVENKKKSDTLKLYFDAKRKYIENKFTEAYKTIIKARDIFPNNQTISTYMTKMVYIGSALRPKRQEYNITVNNEYDVDGVELDIASKITSQPFLIVECIKKNAKYKQNINIYNINKSFKNASKIENMDMEDIEVEINTKKYKIQKIHSGKNYSKSVNVAKCNNLSMKLSAYNSMFNQKSISKIQLK